MLQKQCLQASEPLFAPCRFPSPMWRGRLPSEKEDDMSSVMSGGMHGHSTPISRDHQGNTAGGICTCKAGHQLWCHRAASAGVLQARPAGVMICDSSWLQRQSLHPTLVVWWYAAEGSRRRVFSACCLCCPGKPMPQSQALRSWYDWYFQHSTVTWVLSASCSCPELSSCVVTCAPGRRVGHAAVLLCLLTAHSAWLCSLAAPSFGCLPGSRCRHSLR